MSTTTEGPGMQDIEGTLRQAGLRVTAQRVAVMRALDAHPHASADVIHAVVRESVPGIALPTVHGIVNDLTEAKLVRRVSLPDADRALYELDFISDNHHHLQCIVCGRVEDVACAVGHAPCLTPAHDHGMRVLEATVTFRAVCADCERNGHG